MIVPLLLRLIDAVFDDLIGVRLDRGKERGEKRTLVSTYGEARFIKLIYAMLDTDRAGQSDFAEID